MTRLYEHQILMAVGGRLMSVDVSRTLPESLRGAWLFHASTWSLRPASIFLHAGGSKHDGQTGEP